MLFNFISVRTLTPSFLQRGSPKLAPAPPEKSSSPVKIIHAGGIVEYYCMAVPAVRIMQKYPSLLLARPEIFRRPWDSLVHPEEILTPGEKFFLVPRRTVQKLIQKPTSNNPGRWPVSRQNDDEISNQSITQQRKIDYSSRASDGISSSSNKHAQKSTSSLPPKGKGHVEGNDARRSVGRKRRVGNRVMWQPTLTAIREGSPALGGAGAGAGAGAEAEH